MTEKNLTESKNIKNSVSTKSKNSDSKTLVVDQIETSVNKTRNSKYIYAVGRRKSAVAQVRLYKGTGIFSLNGVEKTPSDYMVSPLTLTNNSNKFDIVATVKGGGYKSQDDAVLLGIARALEKNDQELRVTLKKSGLLTRDPREKERKKPGLKRARKAPQWSKR